MFDSYVDDDDDAYNRKKLMVLADYPTHKRLLITCRKFAVKQRINQKCTYWRSPAERKHKLAEKLS